MLKRFTAKGLRYPLNEEWWNDDTIAKWSANNVRCQDLIHHPLNEE